ncbi:BTAD domain-containing putative transcriptional regulator [Micromonospora pisi]|uniref:BTAD domain-containing putative transcriptional regulator n=1 Tax=Micromonospora pisi TaxID=589240 RepID=UPI001B86B9C0|nr:BTAD domain-containing putative transcriptional regulator [Micromonospora pisi]
MRTRSGEPVQIPELKVRALLADLLVHEGQPVAAERLVADLWGEHPPHNPVGALQLKVSRLRRVLDDAEPGARALLVSRPPGYLLQFTPDATDAGEFAALTRRARTARDPRTRAGWLADALRLWRGPALVDFADWPFAQRVAARLEEERLVALEQQADAQLELDDCGPVIAELGDLVTRHPYREGLRGLHMRALYRSGRQSEALASYREIQARLAEELGVDPGPELVRLHQSMLRQDPALSVSRAVATVSPSRPLTNLSSPISELVGREEAAAEVVALLRAGRLVTLTGPGGVGKTRLAIHTAGEQLAAYPDGVWMVELAPLGRAGTTDGITSVTTAIMTVLGIRETAPGAEPLAPVAQLREALDSKRMLLVLDNCEHLVDAVAEVAQMLLRATPGLCILTTSRESLGVAGEKLWSVPPLDLPPPASDAEPEVLMRSGAVRLFVSRAAAAAPGFRLDRDNGPAVAVLCRRLDGIPLALELAATKVRALGVHAIVARLDDRFRLLAAGHRGAPPRQQTLRGMIDWSWELLSDPERSVLRRLAVHVGGCTLDAAELVCADEDVAAEDVLDLLARLVDRCLVFTTDGTDGPRYHLMESIADYCLVRLRNEDDVERIRRRCRRYYLGLAERAEGELHGNAQQLWLERLDEETANLRAAHDDAVRDGQTDDVLRLANALTWYWFLRGRLREGMRHLTAALEMPGPTLTPARARATAWRAGLAVVAGEQPDAIEAGVKALEEYEGLGDPVGHARAQWFLGFVQSDFGDLSASTELVHRALDGFRRCGDRWGEAAALSTLAKHGMVRGDLAALERHGEQSALIFGELGDRWGQLQATDSLATLAEVRGQHDQAARMHRDGLRTAERLGLWPEASSRLSWLGRIAMLRCDFDEARDLHQRARQLAVEQSYKPGEIFAEMGLGILARREGRLDAAEKHLRDVLEWLPRENYELGDTLPLALILPELGFVAEQRGDAATAQILHLEGLAIATQMASDPRGVVLALEGLAGAQVLAGHHHLAARLLGAAAATRQAAGAPLPPAEQADVDRIMGKATAEIGTVEFGVDFERGRLMSTGACVELVREASPGRPE